ncbi:MAG: tripartite tricarboxylate transporter TctB family protein [Oscillospiraceae bacterium]|nr:tripartite tricarboxylate transporter TctB family protein [Oscillospiraceae bacterium]
MSLKESKAEQIIGIVFAVLGVLFAAVIIPWQIKAVQCDLLFNSPRFFPEAIAVLFIILGACMFVFGRKKKDRADQETYSLGKKEAKLVLLTLAVMVAYTIMLYFLPYIPVTIVTLGFLIWAYGQKSWKKIVIAAVVLPILIYVSFHYGLSLRMP